MVCMKGNLKASLLRRQVLSEAQVLKVLFLLLWKTLLEKRSVMQKEQGRNMSSLLLRKMKQSIKEKGSSAL